MSNVQGGIMKKLVNDVHAVVRETLESFVTGRGTASGNQAS